jgi:uncharacterized membrane protein YkvA (DUF1232 family)
VSPTVWWHGPLGVIAGIAAGLLLIWLALLAGLWLANRHHPVSDGAAEATRLLPDLVRLVGRLAADPSLPRGVRVRLGLLLGYLLLPIDLVPDFIPVLGYLDDALLVAVALRSVARRAGTEALIRHWPGTPAGLGVVHRLAGLPAPENPPDPGHE